jgi:hypothetical protein
VLSPGGNVTLNATQSTCTTTVEDWGYDTEGNWIILGYNTNTFNVHNNGGILPYWSINGTKIAFGLTPTISYDKLVNGLGLTAGTYQLTLDLECYILGRDVATTTLQINAYSGGLGTEADPYRMSTVADWQELIAASADWDKCFILMNDIDFEGANLRPVAPDTDPVEYYFQGIYFTGVFDGKGHVLRNATINLPDMNYVGLFGLLGSGGQIRNLGVENVAVTGHCDVGVLCGANGDYLNSIEGGTISDCYATGTVSGDSGFGGLCGENRGTISGCYATGSVNTSSNSSSVGGLCGENWGTISGCYATGSVNTSNSYDVGGLVGWNSSTISACYATGAVSGDWYPGGLCGGNEGGISACYATGHVHGYNYVGGLCGENIGTISNCYATGAVWGGSDDFFAGGLCGFNSATIVNCYATGSVGFWDFYGGLCGENWSTITACFWDIETSWRKWSSGGTGKTTAEMKTLSTFTDASWDFVGESTNGTADTWRMCANDVDYPRLSWEFSHGGDFDCPDGVALDDLLYLATRWLATTPETIGSADPTSDGKVDLLDLGILAEQWLKEE